jgi:hypothetical protein
VWEEASVAVTTDSLPWKVHRKVWEETSGARITR